MASISCSICSSPTAGSRRATSRPSYSPSSALGSTPISIENSSASPCGGRSPSSTCGSPTGTMPAVSIASEYQLESVSRTASSSTASRPMRWITSGAGTLPRRKPGSFSSRPSWLRLALQPPLELARRHLHLQTHARVWKLGDGGLHGDRHRRHDTVPLRERPATLLRTAQARGDVAVDGSSGPPRGWHAGLRRGARAPPARASAWAIGALRRRGQRSADRGHRQRGAALGGRSGRRPAEGQHPPRGARRAPSRLRSRSGAPRRS